MKLARLIRMEKSQDGILGTLVIDDRIQCFTLERDDTFIKPGQYQCRRFHGTKYPDTFEICVPGHTAVLFHVMNLEKESLGCVGLGSEVGYINGERAILESQKAFDKFMKFMGTDLEFRIFFENRY